MSQIPRIIHYCWFGHKPLPESALKCIASWQKFFPDFEIKEWNEENFDVRSIPYTSQAYDAKKYAFVSDYARFKILYEYGGIYFDTDVEVIKSFDDIIRRGPFMGFEIDFKGGDASWTGCVAPGLGLGVNPGLGLFGELLDIYSKISFINPDGTYNLKTIVKYTTECLQQNGLKCRTGIQEIAGITIYPKEYFNPLDDNTGRLTITSNTHSIHWYSKTWLNENTFRRKIARLSHRIFGVNFILSIRRFFKIPANIS